MKQGHRTTFAVVRKLAGGVAGLVICVTANQARRTFEMTNFDKTIPVCISRTEVLLCLTQNEALPEQDLSKVP